MDEGPKFHEALAGRGVGGAADPPWGHLAKGPEAIHWRLLAEIQQLYRNPTNYTEIQKTIQKFNNYTEIQRLYRNPTTIQKSNNYTEIQQLYRNPTTIQNPTDYTEIQQLYRSQKKLL